MVRWTKSGDLMNGMFVVRLSQIIQGFKYGLSSGSPNLPNIAEQLIIYQALSSLWLAQQISSHHVEKRHGEITAITIGIMVPFWSQHHLRDV